MRGVGCWMSWGHRSHAMPHPFPSPRSPCAQLNNVTAARAIFQRGVWERPSHPRTVELWTSWALLEERCVGKRKRVGGGQIREGEWEKKWGERGKGVEERCVGEIRLRDRGAVRRLVEAKTKSVKKGFCLRRRSCCGACRAIFPAHTAQRHEDGAREPPQLSPRLPPAPSVFHTARQCTIPSEPHPAYPPSCPAGAVTLRPLASTSAQLYVPNASPCGRARRGRHWRRGRATTPHRARCVLGRTGTGQKLGGQPIPLPGFFHTLFVPPFTPLPHTPFPAVRGRPAHRPVQPRRLVGLRVHGASGQPNSGGRGNRQPRSGERGAGVGTGTEGGKR